MKLFFLIIVFSGLLLTARLLIANPLTNENQAPGLSEGRLLLCPDKPNCINSEYPDQGDHYLPPLLFPETQRKQIMALAKSTLIEMGAEITYEEDHYLAAVFTSRLFKFIDDFELRLDKTEQTLHFRSASRTGYSDFGVNKRRVEQFLELINNKVNP